MINRIVDIHRVRDSHRAWLWRNLIKTMDSEPQIPWARVASFMRQHTHDVRNGLNSLDLETAYLQELVSDDESRATVGRLRKQLRSVAEQLRKLSALFQEPRPLAAPIAAHELMLIWREIHASLPSAPEVRWVDELAAEQVNVDVEMMASVFRELLTNATAFWQGEPLTVTAQLKDGTVILDLREPKKETLDTSTWEEPLSTTRRGGFGLGLWAAGRAVEASGGTIARSCISDEGGLTTRIVLPVM